MGHVGITTVATWVNSPSKDKQLKYTWNIPIIVCKGFEVFRILQCSLYHSSATVSQLQGMIRKNAWEEFTHETVPQRWHQNSVTSWISLISVLHLPRVPSWYDSNSANNECSVVLLPLNLVVVPSSMRNHPRLSFCKAVSRTRGQRAWVQC